MSCGCTPAVPCQDGSGTVPEIVRGSNPTGSSLVPGEFPIAINRTTKKAFYFNKYKIPPVWEEMNGCGSGPGPVVTCSDPVVASQSAGANFRALFGLYTPPSCSSAITQVAYQWYRSVNGATALPISGATASDYSVPLTDIEGGDYFLRVTITAGGSQIVKNSNSLHLTATPTCPAIVVGNMNSVTFKVDTASTGSFTIGPATGGVSATGFPSGITRTITGPDAGGIYTVSWTGTPTTNGQTYDVTVSATNNCGNGLQAVSISNQHVAGGSGTVQPAEVLNYCTLPSLGAVSLPQAMVGVPYAGSVQLLNATSFVASGLPAGLSANSTINGANLIVEITGTPTATQAASTLTWNVTNGAANCTQRSADLQIKAGWSTLADPGLRASASGTYSVTTSVESTGGSTFVYEFDFNTNGQILGGALADNRWATNMSQSVAQNFWIRFSVTSGPSRGSFGVNGGGDPKDTWLRLDTLRAFGVTWPSVTNFTMNFNVELATDAAGAHIVRSWNNNTWNITDLGPVGGA